MRFCGNCGAALQEDARFCPKCGSEGVGQTVMQSMPVGAAAVPYPMPNQNDRKKKRRIITAVVVGVIVAVLLLSLLGGNNPVNLVKEGKLNYYPSQEVGEAFDDFFADPRWSSYKDDGDTYVKFTGECTYGGEEVDVQIIFLIDGEEFNIDEAKVEGVPMSDLETVALLNAIYE